VYVSSNAAAYGVPVIHASGAGAGVGGGTQEEHDYGITPYSESGTYRSVGSVGTISMLGSGGGSNLAAIYAEYAPGMANDAVYDAGDGAGGDGTEEVEEYDMLSEEAAKAPIITLSRKQRPIQKCGHKQAGPGGLQCFNVVSTANAAYCDKHTCHTIDCTNSKSSRAAQCTSCNTAKGDSVGIDVVTNGSDGVGGIKRGNRKQSTYKGFEEEEEC
jgi:hypothetical protein